MQEEEADIAVAVPGFKSPCPAARFAGTHNADVFLLFPLLECCVYPLVDIKYVH